MGSITHWWCVCFIWSLAMVICFRLSGVLWVRILIINYPLIFIIQIRLLIMWLYICTHTHTHTHIYLTMHFPIFEERLCLFGPWNTDLKQILTHILLSSLDVFSLISLPLFFVCTVKRYRFCWHLNVLENCPNALRTHNFKLHCVTTFLERAGRKWTFIKQFLCAVFLFVGCFICQFISM